MSGFDLSADHRRVRGIARLALAGLALAACCGGSPAGARTRHVDRAPSIPAALRGCWILDDPDYPGEHDRLVVAGRGLTLAGRSARLDNVRSVSPRAIEGLISARENGHRITIATGLEIGDGDRGGRRGQLILREGDAGSYLYSRCPS